MAMFSYDSKSLRNYLLTLITIQVLTILQLQHGVKSLDSLSFTFDGFYPNQKDLIFQGDATVDSTKDAITLTQVDSYTGKPLNNRVGRVLYHAPVHLWETSSVVASFETTFQFRISESSSSYQTPGDGLTFFLATPDTTIPNGSSGRLLGIFGRYQTNSSSNYYSNNEFEEIVESSSDNRVVAVEFDTFPNNNPGEFDPHFKHIGIDINSIRSSTTAQWNYESGKVATVYVTYDAATTTLTVVSSYPPNSSRLTVSYKVALNNVLPQWVRVGFSASTGDYTQISDILYWSFSSTLSSPIIKVLPKRDYDHQDPHIATVV